MSTATMPATAVVPSRPRGRRAPCPPAREDLPYDPEAIFASVEFWIRRLAGGYCFRRGRLDLADELEGDLRLVVWAKLVAGKYDPDRGNPTTFVGAVARSTLKRAFSAIEAPVYLPVHADGPSRGDDCREAAERARKPAFEATARHFRGSDKHEKGVHEPVDGLPGPLDDAIEAEEGFALKSSLAASWGLLDDRERAVLMGRFFEGRTLKAIGAELGITRERVRQVEGRAIRRLRAAIEMGEA